jgi:hypothetical protein
MNKASPTDQESFVDQYASSRLDVVCGGTSTKCYPHCSGVASFYCPAFGVPSPAH